MNAIKTVITVVAKQRWDMVTDDNNKVKGGKIFVESTVKDENREGMFPTSFSIDYDKYVLFTELPGNYEVEMVARAGSKGVFTIESAKLLQIAK